MCNLGPANKRVGDAEPSSCHDKTQTAPGTKDGPAVAVFHIVRQAVKELRDPVQIIGDAGGVCAERDGAKYACE